MHTTTDTRATCAVFVHGAGGGGWEWAIWQRVFAAAGWRSTAPDLEPVVAGIAATRLDDYTSQLSNCARAATADVWVGASLGGLLAQMCAARSASRALVLINPLPRVGAGLALPARKYAAIVPWGSERSLAATLRAMPDADAAARLFAFARWRDESGRVMAQASEGAAVARPDCPVLVIASEFDEDVAPALSRSIAENIGAEFRLARGASHVGPLLGRCAAQTALAALHWIEATVPTRNPRGAVAAAAR